MPSLLVRSVLGDSRSADIRPGDGFPWFNCPFCGYAVFVNEPHPEHAALGNASRDGICQTPWCLANPAMPLDAARVARGEAILRDMKDEERARNHRLAMQRIESDRKEAELQRQKTVAEAKRRGACLACLFGPGGRPKFVRHRGPCPKSIRKSADLCR